MSIFSSVKDLTKENRRLVNLPAWMWLFDVWSTQTHCWNLWFPRRTGKGEIYVRKMWPSSSFISQFCNGKQAFHKHIHTKPSMKQFMNSSALTKNHSIKTGNNNINNAINHTPSVTSHHHPPSRGESTPLRSKAAASLSSSILQFVRIKRLWILQTSRLTTNTPQSSQKLFYITQAAKKT